MAADTPPFRVIQGRAAKQDSVSKTDVQSPPMPPGTELAGREKKIWEYICEQLRGAGLEHLTCGLSIAIVCRTYVRWLDAEIYLAEVERQNKGTYFVTTPNGHVQPHQAFYVVKHLKSELLKWLPECCLTLPSVAAVRAKTGEQGGQDDLFAELLGHAASRPGVSNG